VKFATGLRRLQADNVQFIPNRSTLSLSERKLSPAGGQLVEIRVSDHGTGLTGDKLEKIFPTLLYEQARRFGVGLSISRSIIEAHGGRLWAENNPNNGATFYFTVPTSSSSDHCMHPSRECKQKVNFHSFGRVPACDHTIG
jgi:K+-sensing histidine kinase KdpD